MVYLRGVTNRRQSQSGRLNRFVRLGVTRTGVNVFKCSGVEVGQAVRRRSDSRPSRGRRAGHDCGPFTTPNAQRANASTPNASTIQRPIVPTQNPSRRDTAAFQVQVERQAEVE